MRDNINSKSLLLAVCLAVFCLVHSAWGQVWNGKIDAEWYFENTEAAEFTITTGEQLAGLAQLVNGGNNFFGKTIILGANILLNDTTDWEKWRKYGNKANPNTWTPIGNNSNLFAGTFDGGGYVISGIYINNEKEYQGLFGYINSSEIKNLGITASFVKAKSYVGSLVGMNYGTIINCYYTGSVQSAELGKNIGGLVGGNYGTITDCYVTGGVNGDRSTNNGGLVGENNGTITNCYATGNIEYGGGGLVGKNSGTITNSYATGNVDGGTSGGLVGENSGAITKCYATGNVGGKYNNGGLVGENKGGIIADCYATGDVEAFGSCVNCGSGGLVGSNDGGAITNCYATGNVEGKDNGGGLIGVNYGHGIIMDSYAIGNVEGSENVGGLIGSNSGKIINSYAKGDAKGRDVGGLIGNNKGIITNCYATGSVKGKPSVDGREAYGDKNYGGKISNVGGLIGKNYGEAITNCYAIGDVNGDRNTGGLIGISGSVITNCYSAGNVSGTTGNTIGGLIGTNNGSQIKNSYYDRQASGQVDIAKGESKSTAQMKQQEIFQGWDFDKVWGIAEDKNNGYPHLQLNEFELAIGNSFTDARDNKKYKAVKIGTQVWMAENLNYDGKGRLGACYDNKPANCKRYGRLYYSSEYGSFEGYCPSGWHVPSNNEWTLLFNAIGKPSGGKLKAKNGWNNKGNGTDEFGFTALPMNGSSKVGIWWSSSNYKDRMDFSRYYYLSIGHDYEYVKWDSDMSGQYSIRCVKN